MQNDGLLICAKYACPPNLLKYCGPEDSRAVFEILNNNDMGAELRNLLSQFEGAVPYLRLIAQSNNIEDVFDPRVVEAYWLGNSLLKNVEPKNMFFNLENRFKKNMSDKDWAWMVEGTLEKAKPHHNFHVLEIYRRTGFLKSGTNDNPTTGVREKLLETINNCSILWGKVVEKLAPDCAVVEYQPIDFFEGKLGFGVKQSRKAKLIDTSIEAGDDVTLHWEYVCDRITPRQKINLAYWTKFHLDLANKTI